MPLQLQQTAVLLSRAGRILGRVVVRRIEGNRVEGDFEPTAQFARLEALFSERIEAINNQIFSIIDELDEVIRAHGLRLQSSGTETFPPIVDVDYFDGTLEFTFAPEPAVSEGRPESQSFSAPVVPLASGLPTP